MYACMIFTDLPEHRGPCVGVCLTSSIFQCGVIRTYAKIYSYLKQELQILYTYIKKKVGQKLNIIHETCSNSSELIKTQT